jgi:2-amino-4-hydroxy-6-hydroxymethyldihydropteridine diphosphokinase
MIVAFGSNIEPERHIPAALADLARHVRIEAVSRIYETPPVGTDGPWFVNGAVRVSGISRAALGPLLKRIEAAHGRMRGPDPNAPRTLDLDIVDTASAPDVAHVLVPAAELDDSLAEKAARFSAEAAAFRRRPDIERAVAATIRVPEPPVPRAPRRT